MMNILEFINSEDVQEEIQHDPIKMKDIIEVKAEDPETAKKRIEKISLTWSQSNPSIVTIRHSGHGTTSTYPATVTGAKLIISYDSINYGRSFCGYWY